MAKKKSAAKTEAGETSRSHSVARDVACDCVNAVAAFRDAAMQWESGKPPDHRPFITRLFAALRQGWEPICRCWPELMEAHRQGPKLRRDKRSLGPSTMAWLTARDVFWVSVVNTEYHDAARATWDNWGSEFLPSDQNRSAYSDDNIDIWGHVRRLLAFTPKNWSEWVTQIQSAQPLYGPAASQSATPPKPALPEPSKPLPTSPTALERLTWRVDDFMDGFETAILEEKDDFISQMAAIRVDNICIKINSIESAFAGNLSRLLPLLRELRPYLDPTIEVASWHQLVAQYEAFAQIRLAQAAEQVDPNFRAALPMETYMRGYGKMLAPYRYLHGQILDRLNGVGHVIDNPLQPVQHLAIRNAHGGAEPVEDRGHLTQHKLSRSVDKGDEGGRGSWAHGGPPPLEESWWRPPIEGFLKDLAKSLGHAESTLKKMNSKGKIWVTMDHGTKFKMWLKTKSDYDLAFSKMAALKPKQNETAQNET